MARQYGEYVGMEKGEIIEAEKKKFAGICQKLDLKTKKSVETLVKEAAFMGASLHELRQVINEKGYVEEYQNGANQKGFKRRNEIEIYNTMIKHYMAAIKQLTDLTQKEQGKGGKADQDGFMEFLGEKYK